MKWLYHFLGGVYLAIGLIVITAAMVIAGTFIEAHTDSHRHAASFTYGSPLFGVLLCLFFINILFAATRRWPFKASHIPFLITHLGLLMVIGGTIIKNFAGTQGTLSVVEGSGSDQILLPGTYALHLQKREGDKTIAVNVPIDSAKHPFPELSVKVTSFIPHVKETLETWIKGDHGVISGYPPFKEMPVSIGPWSVSAVSSDDIQKTALQSYLQWIKSRQPKLVFIQDLQRNVFLFAFDAAGRVFSQSFRPEELRSYIAYDEGYGGYTVQAAIPTLSLGKGKRDAMTKQLRIMMADSPPLAPPLQLLDNACKEAGEDFAEMLPLFLDEWGSSLSLLFPTNRTLPHPLDKVMRRLNNHPWPRGAYWTALLFDRLENPHFNQEDIFRFFNKSPSEDNIRGFLTELAQQTFAVADLLPEPPVAVSTTPSEQARLLSAYFRAYDIDYFLLDEAADNREDGHFTIETPITMRYEQLPSLLKQENNRPLITLEAKKGVRKQTISLSYQPYGTGFKWPILNGEYLIRFQPRMQTIPYRLRLRQARQINYPHSGQPYSYESDVIISRAGHPPVETTLSMNRVYETWDGYRFYLSGMAPGDDGAVKHVQIAVNHDPAKYVLTYPGACLVTLGIVLLFWFKPKPKNP